MTVSPQNELSYLGVRAANPPNVIQAQRAPITSDYKYNIGDIWIDTVGQASYELVSIVGATATWVGTGGGAVEISKINNQAPIAGNYTLAGTAAQITATNTPGTTTFSLPAAITAPGSLTTTTTLASGTTFTAGTGITATTGNIVASTGNITSTLGSVGAATTVTAGTGITATTGNIVASTGNITSTLGSVGAATTVTAGTSITATLGNITATNGNVVLGTAGNKLVSTSVGTTTAAGANSFGSVTLVSGSATVATSSVTAASLIVLWRQSIGATGANPLGELSVGTITPNTQFVITAATTASATTPVATDVSVVGWMIIN
jgi:hypothetical protein